MLQTAVRLSRNKMRFWGAILSRCERFDGLLLGVFFAISALGPPTASALSVSGCLQLELRHSAMLPLLLVQILFLVVLL